MVMQRSNFESLKLSTLRERSALWLGVGDYTIILFETKVLHCSYLELTSSRGTNRQWRGIIYAAATAFFVGGPYQERR